MKRMIDDELLTADKNGITVGKNLEVKGTTKLNNGFEPIYSYDDQAGNTFNIYSEHDVGDGYAFFGDYNSGHIGIGYYTLDNSDNIDTINFLQVGPDGLSVYIGQDNYEQFVDIYKLTEELNTKQNKLYRHILTLNATTEEGSPLVSIIEYLSANNLKVDSLQGLTTLLQPTANYTYPINVVIDKDLGGIYQDYNCLEYSSNVWKFASSNSMTAKVNITSVSDTVTAL